MDNTMIIEAKNIKKTFGGVQALKGVDFKIRTGEIHCLAGENGSGKSTLIKIISGEYTPDSGEIIIGEKKYNNIKPREAIHNGVQVIYQDFSVFPNLTVAENIAASHELAQNKKIVNWKKIKGLAVQIIEKLNLHLDVDAYVENLSIADKQLVEICRALIQDAKVIIMDEPTTALTKKEVTALFKVTSELKKQGLAIVFVSHKTEEVFGFADRLTIFRSGKNVVSEEIAFFNRMNFSQYMTGRELKDHSFDIEINPENILFEVKNISRNKEFENISFSLCEGEVLGITGLLGSGRTKLANAIFGLSKIESGEVYVQGKKVEIHCVRDAIKNNIAYVPSDRLTEGLFLPRSIENNLMAASLGQYIGKMNMINWRDVSQKVKSLMASMNVVAPSAKLPIQALSGGNQQRVLIGKWLNINPDIIIMNGPTVGVDIGSKDDIYTIISDMAKKGIGVIIISDDLPELIHNCNRIMVMKNGRIIHEYQSEDLSEQMLSETLGEA